MKPAIVHHARSEYRTTCGERMGMTLAYTTGWTVVNCKRCLAIYGRGQEAACGVQAMKAMLDMLEVARHDLIAKRERLDDFVRSFNADSEAIDMAEQITGAVCAVEWAERVCRAALVVVEERTPDGVSDTLLDALARAVQE